LRLASRWLVTCRFGDRGPAVMGLSAPAD
jgi:hypothetical protein